MYRVDRGLSYGYELLLVHVGVAVGLGVATNVLLPSFAVVKFLQVSAITATGNENNKHRV